jgi:hypothetical protein
MSNLSASYEKGAAPPFAAPFAVPPFAARRGTGKFCWRISSRAARQ